MAPARQRILLVVAVAALVLVHILLAVLSVRSKSATYDEGGHLRYGRQVLSGDFTRFDDSKMPVSAVNALAAAGRGDPSAWSDLQRARRATIAFSGLVALAVFALARALFGARAGLLALSLYCFNPDVLAHARLVTTDLWAAGAVLLACAAAFWAATRGGARRIALAGAAVGLALLTKYSAVLLVPALPLAWAVHARRRAGADRPVEPRRIVRGTILWTTGLLVVLNAGYLFNRPLTPLAELELRSHAWSWLAARAPWLRLPVPAEWLRGLDWVMAHESSGAGRGSTYLWGALYDGIVPGYYLAAAVVKMPLGLLLLALWALARLLRRWRDAPPGLIFVVLPLALWLLYFNVAFAAQIGMRFVLPATVLLLVTTGSLLDRTAGVRGRLRRWTVWAAVLAATVSALSYHPHYLSYFNALVVDRSTSYRLLADSNLDWGQNELYLERFLRRHPQAVVNPRRPVPGLVVASANVVAGVVPLAGTEWLQRLGREQEPIGHVAYSYLVFDVSPATARRLAAAAAPPAPGATGPSSPR